MRELKVGDKVKKVRHVDSTLFCMVSVGETGIVIDEPGYNHLDEITTVLIERVKGKGWTKQYVNIEELELIEEAK